MNAHISKLLNSRWALPAGVGFIAFAGGTSLGYILGSRKAKIADSEVTTQSNTRYYYYFPNNKEPNITDAVSIGDSTDYSEPPPAEERAYVNEELHWHESPTPSFVDFQQRRRVEEAVVPMDKESVKPVSIWSGRDNSGWDYEVELARREQLGPDEPYIIHVDEYMGEESGYHQSTITYYRRDNILCDESDVPIYNFNKIVGELKFGYGSNDPNVVYVRNPKLNLEWEVLLSTGSYESEVLGMEIERDLSAQDLKHGIPRFRQE